VKPVEPQLLARLIAENPDSVPAAVG
jgi:hypothetical protein